MDTLTQALFIIYSKNDASGRKKIKRAIEVMNDIRLWKFAMVALHPDKFRSSSPSDFCIATLLIEGGYEQLMSQFVRKDKSEILKTLGKIDDGCFPIKPLIEQVQRTESYITHYQNLQTADKASQDSENITLRQRFLNILKRNETGVYVDDKNDKLGNKMFANDASFFIRKSNNKPGFFVLKLNPKYPKVPQSFYLQITAKGYVLTSPLDPKFRQVFLDMETLKKHFHWKDQKEINEKNNAKKINFATALKEDKEGIFVENDALGLEKLFNGATFFVTKSPIKDLYNLKAKIFNNPSLSDTYIMGISEQGYTLTSPRDAKFRYIFSNLNDLKKYFEDLKRKEEKAFAFEKLKKHITQHPRLKNLTDENLIRIYIKKYGYMIRESAKFNTTECYDLIVYDILREGSMCFFHLKIVDEDILVLQPESPAIVYLKAKSIENIINQLGTKMLFLFNDDSQKPTAAAKSDINTLPPHVRRQLSILEHDRQRDDARLSRAMDRAQYYPGAGAGADADLNVNVGAGVGIGISAGPSPYFGV